MIIHDDLEMEYNIKDFLYQMGPTDRKQYDNDKGRDYMRRSLEIAFRAQKESYLKYG